ncbi:hypothetical protein F4553_005787 [Allocatelliglobosispora scoriae]|uniref:Uncharacterized protein n=1 Tax=Allocatelliglobosispora scoriae TaxID=643052 RepID=A0A841BZM8_9ACTN|nr:hypothetical protein [Allocatelliglobosispora scoriae]
MAALIPAVSVNCRKPARTLVRWSYEGTDASEFAIAETARAYGVDADVTSLAESAFLRVWDRMVG